MRRRIKSHAASTRGSGHHPTDGQYQIEERGRRTPPAASVTSGHHRLPERALSSTNDIRDPNRRAFRRVDPRAISAVMGLPSGVDGR
jgi:hypothetical protein